MGTGQRTEMNQGEEEDGASLAMRAEGTKNILIALRIRVLYFSQCLLHYNNLLLQMELVLHKSRNRGSAGRCCRTRNRTGSRTKGYFGSLFYHGSITPRNLEPTPK